MSLIIDCWVLEIDSPLKLPYFFLRNVVRLRPYQAWLDEIGLVIIT